MKRISCVAARAGVLEPRAADRIGRRVLRQVLSSEPLTARHAMALAVEVARKVHHLLSALSFPLSCQTNPTLGLRSQVYRPVTGYLIGPKLT
jgi:hypothetical protein